MARFRWLPALATLAALLVSMNAAAQVPDLRWRVLLVAGDPSLPVWDNAARRLEARLTASGLVVPGQVTRLSQRRAEAAGGARPGGLEATLTAIQAMRPAPGEGCLVFLTMHGAPRTGLIFAPANEVLTPNLLDKVLQIGCGDAPSLVVASGCYSGDFAAGRMARDNRVVLTAARADRSSFGCGAGFELTVFDDCLLQGLVPGGLVSGLRTRVQDCVRQEEARHQVSPPSEPAAHLGLAVRDLMLPPMPAAETPAAPPSAAPPSPLPGLPRAKPAPTRG